MDDYWARHAWRVAGEQGISLQEFLTQVDDGPTSFGLRVESYEEAGTRCRAKFPRGFDNGGKGNGGTRR